MDMQTEQQVDSAKKTTVKRGAASGRNGKRLVWGGVLVVIVVVLLVSGFGIARRPLVNENKNINKSEFQAVFLTNGQVYFGKLADLNNKYVTIKDIYYLQVQQSNNLQGASNSTSPNSQVSLAKLGNELHGPEDKMYIANDQMLFWENLKSDSKVVQAIDKYQSQH